jgi:hypothetical protein
MKRRTVIACSVAIIALAMGCSGHQQYHQHSLGDPAQYQAHFPDMDTNGDDRVSWDEFKGHFPETNPHVFEALDTNGDGSVDHDEWHAFKEAHGLRDH